jgi:hypothetical protein
MGGGQQQQQQQHDQVSFHLFAKSLVQGILDSIATADGG